MKIPVIVIHGDTIQRFDIPAGDGSRTFKWLGLAAAQRFTLRAPHGTLRLREHRGITSNDTSLIPNKVYTIESVFYHPEAILNEQLKEGLEVTIELISRLPVDNLGVPQMATWAFIAFNVSSSKSGQVKEMLDNQYLEIETTRKLLQEKELALRLSLAKVKIQEMRVVMQPQLEDLTQIMETMLEQWGLMSSTGHLDTLIASFQEQGRLRQIFITNYGSLSDMFKHAAAVGSDVGTGTISYMEFSSFMKESNALVDKEHNTFISNTFVDSIITPDRSKVNLSSEMGQHEFFLALISIAFYIHIDTGGANGKAIKARQRKLQDSSTLSSSEAFQKLFDEVLKPYVDKNLDGTSIKAALGSDEVLLLFKEQDDKLSKVFEIYGNRFDNNGSGSASGAAGKGGNGSKKGSKGSDGYRYNMMNIQEFGNCIKDAGLMQNKSQSGVKTHDELSLKDVRQAFSGSQHDAAADDEKSGAPDSTGGGGAAVNKDAHKSLMTYAEFLEGVARVGASKWNEGTLMEKIENAINKIAGILDVKERK